MSDVSAQPTQIMAFTNKNTLTHTREYNKSQAKNEATAKTTTNIVHTKAQKIDISIRIKYR